MMRILFLLFSSIVYSQVTTPTISGISLTPDTNAINVSYSVSTAGTFTVTAASCSGGIPTYTIGTNSITVGSFIYVSGSANATYNTPSWGISAKTVGTTITLSGPSGTVGGGCSGAFSGTANLYVQPFCQIQYGITSGGPYLWSSLSVNNSSGGGGSNAIGLCAIPVAGLKDGTTYYFVLTARPDPDDNTLMTSSSEQSATTLSASVSHLPASPSLVTSNMTTPINTAGYAVVPLAPTGAGGACQASANVNPPSGYTIGVVPPGWTYMTEAISSGDGLDKILTPSNGEVWYGTVFQIPQGVICKIPTPYQLLVLPPDPNSSGINDLSHRFILWTSAPGATGSLPPFGVRTNPSFAANYGTFQCTTAVNTQSGCAFEQGTNDTGHHYAWQYLTFETSALPTDTTYWGPFFQLGNAEGGGGPFTFDQYISIRGNYIHSPARSSNTSGLPKQFGFLTASPGSNWVIADNYGDNWLTGPYGGSFYYGIYFYDCLGNLTCNNGGPILIDNNFYEGMAMGVYFESLTAPQTNVVHDITITHNDSFWPSWALTYAQSLGGYGCRSHYEFKDALRLKLSGNFINGQWACAEPGDPINIVGAATVSDISITSNLITNSASLFAFSGQAVNQATAQRVNAGQRFLYANNLAYAIGRDTRDAGGGGAANNQFDSGTTAQNVTISGNTLLGPSGTNFFNPWQFENTGGGNSPMAGFTMRNNLLSFSIGGGGWPTGGTWIQSALYYQGVPGSCGAYTCAPGAASHPAVPNYNLVSNYTTNLNLSLGYTDGTPGSGMTVAQVASGGTGYPNTGNLIFTNCSGAVGTFNASSGVVYSATFTANGVCTPASMTVTADTSGGGSGATLIPFYGINPVYNWGGNMQVCNTQSGIDMTDSNCTLYSQSFAMPSGDIYPNPAGATAAQRFTAAGLAGQASNVFTCTPTVYASCYAGANIAQLEQALGIVSNIQVAVGAGVSFLSGGAFQVSYTAPDINACYVDTSSNGGSTWSRNVDSGGTPLSRVIAVTGLPLNTAIQYRLLCHFDQSEAITAGWFSFPSDPSNLQTDGSIATPASNATVATAIPFILNGAVTFNATLVGIDGTVYSSSSCTSSPCSVGNLHQGQYAFVEQWKDGSGNILRTGAGVWNVQ